MTIFTGKRCKYICENIALVGPKYDYANIAKMWGGWYAFIRHLMIYTKTNKGNVNENCYISFN